MPASLAYRDGLDFLFRRLNYERIDMPRLPAELRLGRERRLLRLLGDPHRNLKIIHVAGTKGKGSTAAMIAAALSASGLRTGLFCSPHLHRVEERFRIDGQEATALELLGLIDAVRSAVDELDADIPHLHGRAPTFFEITTAMGLVHFARRNVDAVVLEVGLGGRLDSTNVVHPLISVLTTISLDHTRQLGSTTARIAREKAGIIKRSRPVISGVRGESARAVIREVASQRRAPLREIDTDFHFTYQPPEPPLSFPTAGRASVRTWRSTWGPWEMPLLGAHQAHNAAVALAVIDALAEQGMELGQDDVRRGLSELKWPARVEVVSERPWLVIDGAHNVASAEALAETVRTCFPRGPRTLIFGTTRDKDLPGQLRALLPLFDRVIATRYVENPRSVPPAEIAASSRELADVRLTIAPDPTTALTLARSQTPADGLICVTGSLFLAAEARAIVLGVPHE
jgi:dihydrofolate synthase/folylpolyglutamate synthase